MTPIILSLWLLHLPTDRIARLQGASPGEAGLATVDKIRNAQRIAAVDGAAQAGGIRPGMALADARAIRPGLVVHPADQPAETALLEALAAWCSRFTPLVALDGPDGLVLDMTGAVHLFGGERAVIEAIEAEMRGLGLAARAAIASTPEAAWALARFGTLRLCPSLADPKAFRKVVGPLPLAALRLEPETIRILAQAGLRQVGDLLWRPRAPLAARFGAALFARLDGLMGLVKTPISPCFPPPVFVAEQRFASPIVLETDIQRTLEALGRHLCGLMERQNKGARELEARLFRVDGVVKRLTVGTSRPLVHPADLARLFHERIAGLGEEGLDTGYGFDVVRLGVLRADPVSGRQETLLEDREAAFAADDLAALVDRLGARLGLRCVTRLQDRQTHVPERAMAILPAAMAEARSGGPAILPDDLARPIRLFARPEPIETVASVPDGPPQRFRWRRTVHEVAAIEGPERIAPEWWKAEGPRLTRDYFRAEDREGRQFWLFREGLFVTETRNPRWFVHGLFG